MKKKTMFALLLGLGLLLLAGCGQAETAAPAATQEPAVQEPAAQEPAPEEEAPAPEVPEAPEVDLEALEEANSPKAMLSRHKSAMEVSNYGPGESLTMYMDDKLVTYQDFQTYLMLEDGMLFTVDEEKPFGLYATLYLDEADYQEVDDYYRGLFRIWFESEAVISAAQEDGKLCVVTRMEDPQRVQAWIEHYGYSYTEGDESIWSYVFDAESLDLLEFSMTATVSGEEIPFFTTEVLYDVAEAEILTPFEVYHSAEKLRTLSIVYAPGTEAEMRGSFALPKEIPFCVYAIGTDRQLYYTDEACTQDYMGSDAKDYSELVLYLPESRVSAETQQLFWELIDYNSTPSILSRHSNIQCEGAGYLGDEELARTTSYYDAECFAYDYDGSYKEYLSPSAYLWTTQEDGGGLGVALMPESVYAEYFSYYSGAGLDYSDTEVLVDSWQEDDTVVMVTEEHDRENILDRLAYQEDVYGGSCDYEDGMVIVYTARFDVHSADLVETAMTVRKPDGTELTMLINRFFYDVEPFDPTSPENGLAAWFDEDGEFCTVTVVYDPGTAEESRVEYRLPLGAEYVVASLDGDLETFSDPELSQTFTDTVADGDVTVYVKT